MPRKIVTEKTVYKWEELTDSQKEKVLEKHWDLNVPHEWWDVVYEDAARVGIKIEGFDLGHGESVEGTFATSAVDVAKEIVKEHGNECETHKTAAAFLENYEKLSEDEKEDFSSDHELAEEFKKSILEDYRITLRHEYEYQTSRDAVIALIEANEYEFDENGNLA